jgi:hypothetical protein
LGATARFISFALSYPVLGAVEVLFLCFAEGRGLVDLVAGLLAHALGSTVAPLYYMARKRGDFFVSRREDRPLLFLPGVASYAVGATFFLLRGFTSLAALEVASFTLAHATGGIASASSAHSG